jgi:HSP20 family protein
MYNQRETAFQDNQGATTGCGGRGRHWGRHWGRGAFGHRGGPPWARHFGGGQQPVPVNIESTETSFVLTLFAAGRTKESFTLAVQNDVLTISYQGTDTTPDDADAAPDPRYTRREFRNASFERAFQLNGKVLVDSIAARYADGVLTVTLPKNPDTNQPAQGIRVD